MKTLTVILAAAAASVASAQQVRITANVPFAFYEKDQAMAAWRYQMKQGPSAGALTISNSAGKAIAMTLFNYQSGESLNNGLLRFNCYEGGKCFLSEVVAHGSRYRMAVSPGKIEREIMKGGGKLAKVVETPSVSAE